MVSNSRKIRRVSDNLKLGKFIVCLWISYILVTAVSSQDNFYTNGRFGKRKDSRSLSTFQSGSRFGRSDGSVEKNSKSAAKLFEIVPRMDRFFYGSRYGKRSSSALNVERRATEIGSDALNMKPFEAAIDLDRMKQTRQEFDSDEENNYKSERLEEVEEMPYQFFCGGRNVRRC